MGIVTYGDSIRARANDLRLELMNKLGIHRLEHVRHIVSGFSVTVAVLTQWARRYVGEYRHSVRIPRENISGAAHKKTVGV